MHEQAAGNLQSLLPHCASPVPQLHMLEWPAHANRFGISWGPIVKPEPCMQCLDSLNPILILAITSSTFDITQTMQHAWKSHLAGPQLSCSAAQGPALPYGPQQARALRAQHLWPLSSLLLAE